MHEWLHVAGFIHFPNNSARDDVPYTLGKIVREILKEDQELVGTRESDRMSRLLDEAEEVVESGRQH